MKPLYLIAVLFIATLVVVPCLAEEEKQETTEQVADVPEIAENKNDEEPSDTNDEEDEEEAKDEEKAEDADEQIPEEFRDEIEQEKRAFPQLSVHSCRILKKYGYCRYSYIAKFCRKICMPCVDKLSALSCRRVRYTYRACNRPIGRVYCRKACRHCKPPPRPLPIQCKRHRVLNEVSRNVKQKVGKVSCDSKLNGWYRIHGRAGRYIPNKCVPKNQCGTHAPGWMVGQYPRIRGQNVKRKVCFHWNKGCCTWHNFIQVTNCGGYYVFYLKKPPQCSLRYCGRF